MSLLFSVLSRLVIYFLPRSKYLLISWLQSPSSVILEPSKTKFFSVFIVSTSICHEVTRLDATILVFWMLSLSQLFPWTINSPGQNTGVGSLSFLQGIFPTQGLNPGLLHSRWILYQLSHKESPRILEWVACLFSNRSS